MSGVALQIHWKDIEPAQGKLDWSRLDEMLLAATLTHKWIHLLIFPGFWSPSWALVGAQTDTFTVQYGPGKGEVLPLPMPWDPVYLNNWFGFVRQLANRYRDIPALKLVAVAGPTSVSDEFTEPSHPAEIAKWITDLFTSTKYIEAWQQAFQEYGKDFPHQYLSISHGDGLPINADGMLDHAAEEFERTAIVNGGLATVTDRFDFQSSSLKGVPSHLNAIAMVVSYIGTCVTGFQCGTSCEDAPVAMGGAICAGNPPLALTLTLNRGLQTNAAGQHVNYIEIYSTDIEADDLQPVLKWAAAQFPPHWL